MFDLQFITHQTDLYDTYDSAELALKGGCKWIQIRMKDVSSEERRREALRIKELCDKYNAVFIVDDHVELALEINASGVHLGKNDMPPAEARKILGKGFIIGGTANTFDDLRELVIQSVDYVGLGPFRFTTTKKNLSPMLGVEGYASIVKACTDAGIQIPIVAIGGIVKEDIATIMQTGITGIALSGAILNAVDPILETRAILETIKNTKQ